MSSLASKDFRFPEGFLWGAATAAHQIEGAPLADGAGPSIWTRFAHTPGMTLNGDTGDVACDHYHRWKEDVGLMRELGLQAYRFSVSWSRILPEGTGRVNQKGLDFYSRLVDELLANGIEPLLTLYHWDMPAALDDRGGWLNRDCADWFAEYGRVLYRALDGRVRKWVTLNEPWVVTDGGYLHGALAPGHRSRFEAPIAAHNLMRAHGAAVQAYRAEGAHEIGLVVNIEPKYPAGDSEADAAAVRRAHAYMNEQFLHPALLGRYPDELRDIFGEAWPDFPEADFGLIRQPLDFVGINYYTRSVTGDGDSYPQRTTVVRQPLGTYTETGWEVFPQGLTDLLLWFKRTYGDLPVYITENGAAFFDPPVAEEGRVRDPLRIDYLRKHLAAIHDAIAAGVDVRGYMAWSLLDNLEWSLGYSKRFGIIHVNYGTLERTPKDSARWYSGIIRSHGRSLSDPLPY
ncbi:GH1 family beta-glucosidase [Luteimonas composti]|uniref:Beta-glucosidase n=1 Tax=Luteimonas composti TaxID=398257 RepID=A0ABT6MMU2_9GAMM|nr:GH1 family beta-glucosidase [Luteimonas composti]MDH7451615.1 GH1 family beta-glucosidase [Luteimonas composti]